MTTFVDTSAVLAFLDADDTNHRRAVETFDEQLRDERLVTHTYIIVETLALIQRRSGPPGVRHLVEGLVPRLEMLWVTPAVHGAATSALIAITRRRPSMVDFVSFEVMRRNRVERAFAFDKDFRDHGFRTIP